MANGVNGDPEEIRRFACALSAYIENISEATGTLSAEFAALSETWKDDKQAAFEENIRSLQSQISQFSENCGEYIPYLQALASHLEDYLNT